MPTPEQMDKLFQAVEATARYAAAKEKQLSYEELKAIRAQALTAQLDCAKTWCG